MSLSYTTVRSKLDQLGKHTLSGYLKNIFNESLKWLSTNTEIEEIMPFSRGVWTNE